VDLGGHICCSFSSTLRHRQGGQLLGAPHLHSSFLLIHDISYITSEIRHAAWANVTTMTRRTRTLGKGRCHTYGRRVAVGGVGNRAGNEPSRLSSARPFHELTKEARLGSTLAREPARLASHILVLTVTLFGELILYKFEI
jgi:hypothetical protein